MTQIRQDIHRKKIMNYTKRFIEESFPVKEVSFYSAKEKNIRHGHISTLHIWWARRPLAASRSTAFAALVPATDYEEGNKFYDKYRKKLISILRKDGWAQITEKSTNYELVKHFIITLCKWENSNKKEIIDLARQIILDYNKGVPPKVLDPFGGGGSIPLECLRLGCETYSNDLNPVAVLIQKCTLEYPQKYGKPGYVEREVENFGKKKKEKIWVENVLLEDVKYWGNWVLEEAKKELAQFYPPDPDGSIPVGYLWARTIPCQNPACGAEIPLIKEFWVSKKETSNVAVLPFYDNGNLEFIIIGDGYSKIPSNFNPTDGSISRAVVCCVKCGNSLDANNTRKLFREGKASSKMFAMVIDSIKKNKKVFRKIEKSDNLIFEKSRKYLLSKIEKTIDPFSFDSEFGEELPLMSGVFNVPLYGINTWGKLYNERQRLSLITFIEKIKCAKETISKVYNPEYARAVSTFITFGLDKLATHLTVLTRWRNDICSLERIFDKQALPMIFDYGEANPFSTSRGHWDMTSIIEMIHYTSWLSQSSTINQFSSTQIPFNNSSIDSVFTDPPYYNSVPYADLSDFFYTIEKRVLSSDYPELFSTPLTPKQAEITEMAGWDPIRYEYKDQKFFEKNLEKSFCEMYRILVNGGIAIVVYAHKTTAGWETLINSLNNSGLIVTAAYPLNTELSTRARAQDSAALASSIYIVCRKIDRQPTAFYNDVKEETKNYLSKKLDRLWNEGISGPDFFIAAIGSSIEVFGKYEKVMDYEGNVIRANKLLEDVRVIVTDYAVKKILHNGFATGISELTRFYVLCRWEFKAAKIPFDEANKLAHSCHIELADYWQTKSFIKKEKEFVLVLGPQDRDIDDLEDSVELIDVLHYAIKLWEKGKKAEMQKLLNESGYAKSDSFFRVAQAIAETLPNESKEKKLLEGFLNLREKISESFKTEDKEKGFFD